MVWQVPFLHPWRDVPASVLPLKMMVMKLTMHPWFSMMETWGTLKVALLAGEGQGKARGVLGHLMRTEFLHGFAWANLQRTFILVSHGVLGCVRLVCFFFLFLERLGNGKVKDSCVWWSDLLWVMILWSIIIYMETIQ